MTLHRAIASDYAVAGILMHLHASEAEITRHSFSIEALSTRLQFSLDSGFTPERVTKLVAMIERLGVGSFYEDPFAEPIFQVDDSEILAFFTIRSGIADIYKRAWNLELDWLQTAFRNERFWEQVDKEPLEAATRIPVLEPGRLKLDSNSEAYLQASELVDDLIGKLIKANDLGNLSAEDAALVRKDLLEVKEGLQKQEVESPSFYMQARTSLVWLAKEAAATIVGALALVALAAIFNIPVSPL